VTTADSSQLASDNAAFAFDVYNKLVATNSNVVFSPLSISIALAMTYAGAAGTTASEMASTLHFSLPPARLHAAFNALDLALTSRGQGWPVKINVANALWADKTLTFKSDFLDTLAANYGAGVNLLDFINAPDPSRQTINAWVASQTNNKIQDLLPVGSISDQTRLVLTNAIYLDATWHVFDSSTTVSSSFMRLDGSGVTVKFMDAPIAYLLANRATNFVAASLPYANPDLSLVVVVPDLGKFAEVESSLNATTLATLMAGMTTQSVGVYLPRFQIKTVAGLAETLRALGMKSAFAVDGTANFSGMSDEPGLHLLDVIHKAFISVAEAGTEAAAATGVVMAGGTSGHATPTPALILDASRPFLYFLRDQPTGTIVFMGRVMDPSAN
jgi:serpin B